MKSADDVLLACSGVVEPRKLGDESLLKCGVDCGGRRDRIRLNSSTGIKIVGVAPNLHSVDYPRSPRPEGRREAVKTIIVAKEMAS